MWDKTLIADELFIDAVAEVLNVGMGNAAASLSEMTNEEVSLSLPSISFVSCSEAIKLISKQAKTDVSGVRQHFQGAFHGDAMLLFPEEQSLELVRTILQQDDLSLQELSEMEQEAMTEIGNIILNACLGGMVDMFGKEIQGDIPDFVCGSLNQVLSPSSLNNEREEVVLLLNMDFSIETKNVQGYVTFLMDVKSATLFKEIILNFMGG